MLEFCGPSPKCKAGGIAALEMNTVLQSQIDWPNVPRMENKR